MHVVTKSLEIDAGHRLPTHKGLCRNYHGHRYRFDLVFASDHLNADHMVVDFDHIKSEVGYWLSHWWDHAMILHEEDPLVLALRELDSKVYVLNCFPTAECLAMHLSLQITTAMPELNFVNDLLVKVVCHETPTSAAEYAR